MPAWPAKDPDAVADYRYTIPLDDGDSVSSHSLTLLSGTVTLNSESRTGADLTAWLSGGADGETSVFRLTWTTAGGRTLEDIITLPVAANELVELAGYDKPTPAHLTARYPAFASVPVATIRTWLTDAQRIVTASWDQADYAPAMMALAAHNMTLGGLGASGTALIPAGVTRFRSASMDVSVTEQAANATANGGYKATRYGIEFEAMLRRNIGGMRLIAAGRAICGVYP